jgi:hypothetical protein
MRYQYPPAPAQYSSRYFTDLVESIRSALTPGVSKDEAVGRILLLSPNGTVYEVKVDDAGNLVTSVNDGKSRL